MKGGEAEFVLAVAGDIDAGSHHRFRHVLSAGIDRSDRVMLDLGALDVIDSTGLNGIEWAGHEAYQRGRQLTVRGAPPRLRRLLQRSGLERLIQPGALPS